MSLGLSSALTLSLSSYVPATTPVSYDYTITSNAEWGTIPAGLLAGGGLVGVAPGNYSNITFTATPSAMLTITGTDINNMPIIDKLEIGNIANITLTDMRIVSSDWSAASVAAIKMGIVSGTCVISGPVSFTGLKINGNYRGDIDAHATFDYSTDDIPEYACIHATVTGGSFPVGALFVPSFANYVGDLVADGTNIPLSSNNSEGTGFTGFMNVSGGRIVYAECTAGGSGYYATASTPGSSPNPYVAIGWTNRHPMANYLPRGIEGKMSIVSGGQFSLTDNEFTLVGSAYKPSFASGATTDWFRARNNVIDGCYLDVFATTLRSAPTLMSYEFNKISRLFCRVGDANDPHGDGFQHLMFPSTGNWVPRVEFIGNEAVNGSDSRGDATQYIFMSDANGHAYEVHAVGNAGLLLAPNGILADVASNSYFYGNTSLPGKTTHVAHTSAISILLSNGATTQAYGQSLIEANIAEDARTGATASSKVTLRNNVKTGLRNLSVVGDQTYYDTLFGNHTEPNTIAELRSMRTAIGADAGKGAYRDASWVNHTAMTYDRSLEPSFVKFPTVINQTASSTATSAWAKIIGGPDSQSVSVSGGTFDTATSVDLAGTATGVTTGLTSATLSRGTWVRMNVATASTGSTATTATMTIRGTYTFDFNAITATASSYTIADNQGTAYSRITSLPTFTGGVGFIWALRFRVDAYATSDYLFANQTGTQLNLQYQTNQWRLTMKNGSTVGSRFVMSQQAGTMVTLIAAFDLTQTDKELACRMFSNGVELSHASSNSAYGGPTTLANTDIWNTQSLNILSNNTGTLDGAIEWLWFDIYTSIGSMPDVSDPAVLAEFSTDKFAADFSTSILPQPKLAYGGASSLASWDGTFTNAGSHAGANLVKQAGTYV